MLFGRTVDIRYDCDGAHAICSYGGNEDFLNSFFDEVRNMAVSDDPDQPCYFLEPIIKMYFTRYAYKDFIKFLTTNDMYSDAYFKNIVTNEKFKQQLIRISAVICSYKFI